MNYFLAIFEDGNKVPTGMSGDLNAARNYYVGRSFELVEGKMSKCVDVKQIPNED
jgi:hypothetical protein